MFCSLPKDNKEGIPYVWGLLLCMLCWCNMNLWNTHSCILGQASSSGSRSFFFFLPNTKGTRRHYSAAPADIVSAQHIIRAESPRTSKALVLAAYGDLKINFARSPRLSTTKTRQGSVMGTTTRITERASCCNTHEHRTHTRCIQRQQARQITRSTPCFVCPPWATTFWHEILRQPQLGPPKDATLMWQNI